MSRLGFRPRPASLLWLEGHRIQAAGTPRPAQGLPTEDQLAQALGAMPQGPSVWVVDDLWAPATLLRDVVELPAGQEGREGFFRWKYAQALALEGAHSVQALGLGEGTWLLAGLPQELRDGWLALSQRLGRPIHALIPRWLWLYNRLAPSREVPGMLLSLSAHPEGGYTGTLAAWGRTLAVLRQWSDPAFPGTWMSERVAPTAAYLQRESRTPQELWVWGAPEWPSSSIPHRVLQPEIPAQEAL